LQTEFWLIAWLVLGWAASHLCIGLDALLRLCKHSPQRRLASICSQDSRRAGRSHMRADICPVSALGLGVSVWIEYRRSFVTIKKCWQWMHQIFRRGAVGSAVVRGGIDELETLAVLDRQYSRCGLEIQKVFASRSILRFAMCRARTGRLHAGGLSLTGCSTRSLQLQVQACSNTTPRMAIYWKERAHARRLRREEIDLDLAAR
jgi:hypothetical protein